LFAGQHRNFGTHISKIKSVNLDKWPAGKVQVFQALTNDLVNSYWEANLPSSYQKPGPSAPNQQVVQFMTDKYINKKWVDTKMKYDPLYLFENKREKFDKWLRKKLGASNNDEEEVPKPPVQKKIVSQPPPISKPVQPAMPHSNSVPIDDLIGMKSSNDVGFEEFQSAPQTSSNNQLGDIMNLYNPAPAQPQPSQGF
jgi:hypothetical protein